MPTNTTNARKSSVINLAGEPVTESVRADSEPAAAAAEAPGFWPQLWALLTGTPMRAAISGGVAVGTLFVIWSSIREAALRRALVDALARREDSEDA